MRYLIARLVSLHDDGRSVISLHLGSLDHLICHVHVLGMMLVVMNLRKNCTRLSNGCTHTEVLEFNKCSACMDARE